MQSRDEGAASSSTKGELNSSSATGGLASISEVPFISVIVPVYDNPRGIRLLLQALAEQSYPADRYECLVIENCPDAQTPEFPGSHFSIRTFLETKPGSYAARNCGIRNARGELLAFTDSDCLPHTDWLERAADAFRRDRSADVIAGRIEVRARDTGGLNYVERFELICGFPQRKYVEELSFGATANLVCRRTAFDEAGFFDDTLFSSGDLEWGRRLADCGKQIKYCDDAAVTHPARSDARGFRQKYRRIAGGRYTLARRQRKSLPRLIASSVFAGTRRLWACRRDPRLRPLRCKLQVLYAETVLRTTMILEYLRLASGGKPRRR